MSERMFGGMVTSQVGVSFQIKPTKKRPGGASATPRLVAMRALNKNRLARVCWGVSQLRETNV